MSEPKNEIVVYQPDDTMRLDVRLQDETVWLSQEQMCQLFQRDQSVVARHIKNAFAEGEVDETNNMQILHKIRRGRPLVLYSLDVIIFSGTGPAKARFFNVFVALAQPSPLVRASLPSFCLSATSERIHFQFTFLSQRCGMMHLSPREATSERTTKWQGPQESRNLTTEPRDTTSCRAPTTGASCSRRGG